MSVSTSCSDRARALLDAARRGEHPPDEVVRATGEECPAEFFRLVVEPLADSFDPKQAEAYTRLMSAWNVRRAGVESTAPIRAGIGTVYVLSRVTLGADIKITSAILDAAKHRFPDARIVLVGNRKSAELFEADPRIEHLEARYPRTGPVSARLEFAADLRSSLEGANRIVIDPDSRMTQLGLAAVCEPENYFHFPSRTIGGDSAENLSDLTERWLQTTFGQTGRAYVAVKPVHFDAYGPIAAVNLGVGDNESKRIGGDFETMMIRALSDRYQTIWIDRGAGGEEARRVTAAGEACGASDRIRYWEGSFAGFVSIVEQSDLYVGYDSGGQHAAAAAGTPLVSIFAGAPSERFRHRWSPQGRGSRTVIAADGLTPENVLGKLTL